MAKEGIVSQEIQTKHKMPTSLTPILLLTAKGCEPRGWVDITVYLAAMTPHPGSLSRRNTDVLHFLNSHSKLGNQMEMGLAFFLSTVVLLLQIMQYSLLLDLLLDLGSTNLNINQGL